MHIDTQFSVFLVNKPGVLATVMGALAKSHVGTIALTLPRRPSRLPRPM
jgi:hypothetical protein